MPVEQPAAEKIHWNKITPRRLVIVFAVVVFLISLPSKGWPVLIFTTGVIAVGLYVLGGYVLAFLDERPFQFSIRSMLLFTAVIALACGWMTASLRQAALQEKAIAPYGLPWSKGLYLRPSAPNCLCALFGDEFFRDISYEQEVWYSKETEASDADLVFLNSFRDLRMLRLESPNFTDAALEYVQDHKSLIRLDVRNVGISDVGLSRLATLGNLRELRLINTKVTDAGIARFRAARPDVKVIGP